MSKLQCQPSLFDPTGIESIKEAISHGINSMTLDAQVDFLNELKVHLHAVGPFKDEPVDCVLWKKSDSVVANDYNPNKVAPPEMELLEVSIMHDGYTQPIVTWPKDSVNEVIDGFHRSRVGKESAVVRKRVLGYLPVVEIRSQQTGKNDRIASTIRHNRARGKHQIDAMSEIVLELKSRNWKNQRIAKELGMDEEEILRLCQITGLDHLFADKDFSRAWEAADSIHIEEFMELTDEVSDEETNLVRTINTNDPNRIFHTYEKWECAKAGFYASAKEGTSHEECERLFAELLADTDRFLATARAMMSEWKHSCEHYLTNKAMNRIAWIGQASVCFACGVPSRYSSAWASLTPEQQDAANQVALVALNEWLVSHGMTVITLDEAVSTGRQVEIY